MDVWKIKDTYVMSETSSDGWNIRDSNGKIVMIGGDAKIMRNPTPETWDNYKEYHYEFNGGDYYDFIRR